MQEVELYELDVFHRDDELIDLLRLIREAKSYIVCEKKGYLSFDDMLKLTDVNKRMNDKWPDNIHSWISELYSLAGLSKIAYSDIAQMTISECHSFLNLFSSNEESFTKSFNEALLEKTTQKVDIEHGPLIALHDSQVRICSRLSAIVKEGHGSSHVSQNELDYLLSQNDEKSADEEQICSSLKWAEQDLKYCIDLRDKCFTRRRTEINKLLSSIDKNALISISMRVKELYSMFCQEWKNIGCKWVQDKVVQVDNSDSYTKKGAGRPSTQALYSKYNTFHSCFRERQYFLHVSKEIKKEPKRSISGNEAHFIADYLIANRHLQDGIISVQKVVERMLEEFGDYFTQTNAKSGQKSRIEKSAELKWTERLKM